MRVKRCTRVIIAAFLLLLISSFFLDKPGLLAVSLSLWILIIWRYIIFFKRLKLVVNSITINRNTDKSLIRQGMICTVTTRISLTIEEGIAVIYSDLTPAGVQIEDGLNQTDPLFSGVHELTLKYSISAITHGNITFPGGNLTVQDQFFETTIQLLSSGYIGPALLVQPAPFFEKKKSDLQSQGVETNKFLVQRGNTIKTYRKYLQDDDSRLIDWKVSAKRDELYVREFTSLESNPPLLIIDLPDVDQDYSEENFSKLVRTISTKIETEVREGTVLSLLIISGPNIITFLSHEYYPNSWMTIIREQFHPRIRLHHLYRTKQRIELRKMVKDVQNQNEKGGNNSILKHYSLISTIYKNHLLDNGKNRFSSQISRIFITVRPGIISLYSLCEGDISHIKEIAHLARFDKIRFILQTTQMIRSHDFYGQYSSLRTETIEEIP